MAVGIDESLPPGEASKSGGGWYERIPTSLKLVRGAGEFSLM